VTTSDLPMHDAAPHSGTLRTLLVTSDGEVLDAMRRAFGASGFEVAGEAWPGIDAARRAAALSPDVVVLHIEEPIVPALRTVQAIAESCEAGLAVISSTTNVETMRRVMNAGAHDFATLPLADEGLQDSAIRAARAVERRRTTGGGESAPASPSGTVITVAGPRGGVGKTTIASNLAIELAKQTGTAVAIADLDLLFGGVAIALDLLPQSGLQDWLRDHEQRTNSPVARHLTDHHSGLRLLAAPTEPDASVEFTPADVADLVTDLSGTNEYVVLDTAGSFSPVTAAAIDLSPLTLVVTSPDLSSLRATRYLVDTLRGWDVEEERINIVLNHPTPVLSLSHEEAQEGIGLPVTWDLPHDTNVLRAAAAGVPVSDFKSNAPVTQELREIARFVAGVAAPRASRRRLLGVF
jgi:pilus assembly protein CpaE